MMSYLTKDQLLEAVKNVSQTKSEEMNELGKSEEKTSSETTTYKEAHQKLLKLSPKERAEIVQKAAEKRGYY